MTKRWTVLRSCALMARKELSEFGDEWFADANAIARSFPGDPTK